MQKIIAVLILSGFVSLSTLAQKTNLPELTEPTKLNDLVNTRNEELMPWIYKDGKSLILTRILNRKKKEVMEFVRKDSVSDWTLNTSFKPMKDAERTFIVGITNSGDTVYQLKATSSGKMLSIVRYIKSVRRSQIMVQKIPFEGKFYTAYVFPGESVILLSVRAKGSMGLEDLYVIRKTTQENG